MKEIYNQLGGNDRVAKGGGLIIELRNRFANSFNQEGV
jgi:hypothetical protein